METVTIPKNELLELMRNYYYTTRRGLDGWTDVVLCSWHTNDVKEVVSSHRNAHNARQRAAKLNRER